MPLVGGLAVGVHGWPRWTKDVDFLIGREGYDEHPAGLVTLKAPSDRNRGTPRWQST